MQRSGILGIVLLLLIGLLPACTEDIELEVPPSEQKVVIEGYIETNGPPLVLVSRSLSFEDNFFAALDGDYFIENAEVYVTPEGGEEVQLEAVTIDNLTEIAETLPVEADFLFERITVYTTAFVIGQENTSYDLRVVADGQTFTARTRIKSATPLDSLYYVEAPVEDDRYVLVRAVYNDPPGEDNYMRLQTQRNQEPFFYGGFLSVYEDNLIDGKRFEFDVDRRTARSDVPDPQNAQEELATFGYFERGDTVRVRWSQIDEAQFTFWRTLETNAANSINPFASPIVIASNIEGGGVGIWGGYAPSYQQLIIPE